jgi:hypothetical protein
MFKVLLSLKVKLLLCELFLLEKCTLDRQQNQGHLIHLNVD